MRAKPGDADAYLATLSADKRAALEKVRRAIRAAAPEAEESLSYGVPAFIQGKPIAGYAAGANHCSYYPMSGAVIRALQAELRGYETSKGAIRFPVSQPPPATLIRKLVKARLAEIAAASMRKTAARKRTVKPSGQTDAAVIAYLRDLEHPLKKEIGAVRRIVLGVRPTIREGIKWNVPSFRTEDEWFATFNVRARESVQLILHLGAKVRSDRKAFKLADPQGLLKWLGQDRALVTLGAGRDIPAHRAAFEAIVRAWIEHV